MADIHLHAGSASSVTCISNYFIDHFLKVISGDAVKVYLALLRCLGDRDMSFSCSEMAAMVGGTAREVRTSLDALASEGLVTLDYDDEGELCDICVNECGVKHENVSELSEEEETDVIEEEPDEEPQVPAMTAHKESERNNPEVKTLLFIAQRYLGHTLTNDDLNKIMYWYYDLHMSVDVIDYLITSTIEKGKTSITYMDHVAIEWYKKGIRTKDEASGEQKQFSTEANTVRKAFGISGHAMTPAELEYIDRWFHEWGFSPAMVEEACGRTVTNTGRPNYSYADKILGDWHEKGIGTPEQIAEDDSRHEQEVRDKYPSRKSSGGGAKNGSFSFEESNGYDDAAIASAMLKRNTF